MIFTSNAVRCYQDRDVLIHMVSDDAVRKAIFGHIGTLRIDPGKLHVNLENLGNLAVTFKGTVTIPADVLTKAIGQDSTGTETK